MQQSSTLSSSNLAAISTLHAQLEPGRATALNPSDPVHRAAIDAALSAAGRTQDRYPGLYGKLPAASGGDHLTLVDQGRDRSGRATAMTWHAASNDPLYAGGTLFALDGDSDALLALGHNSNVGEGFVPVSTDTASAKAAGKSLKVLTVSHSVSRSGDVRFTAVAGATSLDDTNATVNVTEPTQTPKTPPNLVIALGRDSSHSNPDADYTYTEPYNMTTPPWLIVPFTGTAALPYDIQGTPGQPISGATLATQIFFVASGVTYNIYPDPTYTPQSRINNGVTMLPGETNLLQWSYPADGGSYSTTTSLVYSPQSLVNEQISYFLYTFQIPVANAPVSTFSFAVCSTGTPNEPSYQCVNVPPIMFWWHCLAAGTKVKLADGSEAPIETLDNTRRVATGTAGGALAVEATSRGAHQASKGEAGANGVYRLTTQQGHALVGTGMHTIMTPSGLRPLAELAAGDEVTTETGTAKVSACEPIGGDGVFYNLKLGDAADRAAGLAAGAICTYVANGIVVGDHLALKAEQRRRSRDVARASANLPADLAADYASAVADIRY